MKALSGEMGSRKTENGVFARIFSNLSRLKSIESVARHFPHCEWKISGSAQLSVDVESTACKAWEERIEDIVAVVRQQCDLECAAFQIDREAWAEKTETAFRNLVQDADFIVPCTQ